MNPFDISKPCIKIISSEVLFEQYRNAFNQEKYDIKVWNDDEIKRNKILFDFILRTLNRLDGLYLHEKCLFIVTTKEYQLRKQSAAEIEK